MIPVSGTSQKFQLVTSVAGAIDVLIAPVQWDTAGGVGAPLAPYVAEITGATTTDVLTGNTTGPLSIGMASFKNVHATLSNTLTLQHYSAAGALLVSLVPFPITLLPGWGVIITEGGSPRVFDAGGGLLETPSAGVVDPKTNDFRVSGVTGASVMAADSTTLSNLYLTPHFGNRIALYDGSNWQLVAPSTEPSIAVSGRTTDLPFDVFCYLSGGAPVLEVLNWTSATARATNYTRLDGVRVKSGDPTRRLVASVRPRSATTYHWVTQGLDSPVKLDLFNVDNPVDVQWQLRAGTNTWAYTVATWRQCQASANYQVDVMVGLPERYFGADLMVSSRNSTISIPRQVGIGFDSTTAFTGVVSATANTVASIECDQNARIGHFPGIGRHFYAWLEISTATGTCTWIGDDGALRLQSGMSGVWSC